MGGTGRREERWRVRPPDQVAWKEVGDEVVILDLRTSVYWTLNGSATLLWMALVHGASIADLAKRLADEFDVDMETAAHDAEVFFASCDAENFLESI